MVYDIVNGPSKLLCNLLPYLKTKKNDLITTYAKRWTTTVHYLKLICDRRCATMSFIYFLNVWVINLDRIGHTINILVRVTIRAAIFQTDCNLESRCFGRPYSSELQLSNIEVIKAWTTILALSSSIYFVIWATTQTYTLQHTFFRTH